MRLYVFIFVSIVYCIYIVYCNKDNEDVTNSIIKHSPLQIGVETSRKNHREGKMIIPLLLGVVLAKSILLLLALKAMVIMSGIAVLLSSMSLIISSILGFMRSAIHDKPLRILFKYPISWAKNDGNSTNFLQYYPLSQSFNNDYEQKRSFN